MLCLSAGIQKTVSFESFASGEVNRSKSYRYDASGKAINSARVLTQLISAASGAAGGSPVAADLAMTAKSTVASEASPGIVSQPEFSATDSVGADLSSTPADSSAGTPVSIVCPLGERNKDFFLEMARADGLNVKVVPIPGFTRECCTLLDEKSGQTTELVVEEPVPTVDSTPYEEKLMELLAAELGLDGGREADGAGVSSCDPRKAVHTKKADALLFSGSRPKFWNARIIKRIAAAAKANDILFMADFRGNDLLSILSEYTPDIIKINEDEFWATFGDNFADLTSVSASRANAPVTTCCSNLPNTTTTISADSAKHTDSTNAHAAPHTEQQLSYAITETSRSLNNIVVVTRGAKPTLAAEKGTAYTSTSERVKAINTIGCGDAYNAGFLYEYLTTKDMQKSLEKGKWCASRNAECLRPGVLKD